MGDADDINETVNAEPPPEEDPPIKKEPKKRKIKDDTEQPIYPCEECTQCFTTISDLKVHINKILNF